MKFADHMRDVLNAFSHTHFPDYLSRRAKHHTLQRANQRLTIHSAPPPRTPKVVTTPKRIALLVASPISSMLAEYAITTCERRNAELDILALQCTISDTDLEPFHNSRITVSIINLDEPLQQSVHNYIRHELALLSLIASAEDTLTRDLIENMTTSNARIHTPVILIHQQTPISTTA